MNKNQQKDVKKTTIHVEASIIGTLICAPEYFATANKSLKPEMFQHYRGVYDWMYDLDVNKMMGWDIQMAASKFGDISDLIVASEPETISAQVAYLKEQHDAMSDSMVYFDAIRQLDGKSPYDVREYVLANVGENNEIEAEKTRGDKMYEAWQDIETGQIGVPTYWKDFNNITGGVQKGQTGFIAGTTGTGKTEKALRLLIELAKSGKPVAFFSMELTEKQIWQRVYKIESGLSMKDLSSRVFDPVTGKYKLVLPEYKMKMLSDALKRVANIPFYVFDMKETTNKGTLIRQKIRWCIRKYDLFAYCLDYIQLCETGIDKIDNSGNDVKILSKLSKDFSAFNKAAGVLGVLLTQFNRGVDTRADRRPHKEDVLGSSAMEHAADWMLLLFRPGAYEDWSEQHDENGQIVTRYNYKGTSYNRYDCEYIIAKNRAFDGQTGSWWEWQEPVSNQFPVKQESAAQPKYDTAVPANAGRENLEAGELPF